MHGSNVPRQDLARGRRLGIPPALQKAKSHPRRVGVSNRRACAWSRKAGPGDRREAQLACATEHHVSGALHHSQIGRRDWCAVLRSRQQRQGCTLVNFRLKHRSLAMLIQGDDVGREHAVIDRPQDVRRSIRDSVAPCLLLLWRKVLGRLAQMPGRGRLDGTSRMPTAPERVPCPMN